LRKFKRISDIESSTVTSEFGGKFKDPQQARRFFHQIRNKKKGYSIKKQSHSPDCSENPFFYLKQKIEAESRN
jgi:hypothetical protein